MDQFIDEIQELIDRFPDDYYEDLLEEMIDRAESALAARREENGGN